MKKQKYIKELTEEQKARMPEWGDKWVKIGLQTGETDWDTFDENIKLAYEKAKVPFPTRVVRVSSPFIGALASSIAHEVWNKRNKEKSSVRDSVGDSVRDSVGDSVRASVGDSVRASVGDSVGDSVEDSVRDSVGDSVRDSVEANVRDSVGDSVGDSVRDSVGDSVRDSVRDSVGDSVRDSVGDSVRDSVFMKKCLNEFRKLQKEYGVKASWNYWLGGQFWVGYWWGSPSYVSFFTEVCGLELEKDIQERASIYDKLCRSVNYIWCNKHYVMVCARPIRIARNENGQLHSDQVKAIEYPDGWGLYVLDGVVLSEDLWKKILSQTMTFKEIIAIEISDQRTVALKYNPEVIIKENSVMVHRDDRNNELYMIENQQLNKDLDFPKIWFLKMLCPTGRTFIEGCDPNIVESMGADATKLQAYACGLTLSEYQL